MKMKRLNYRCIVDGQQEKMYLNHLASLLTHHPDTVVNFNISIDKASRLSTEYHEYDSVCLFDYDFDKNKFEQSLTICHNLNKKKAKQKEPVNVYHAYSNVCFDLWLVLHKQDFNSSVYHNNAYVNAVRHAYKLPPTADIKDAKTICRILKQISLSDVETAINRAKNIRASKIPAQAHSVNGVSYFDNPDFSLHEFIEKVINATK